LLLPCIFFLLGACIIGNVYTIPSLEYEHKESSNDFGPISTNIYFSNNEKYVFPFLFLQSVLPPFYEEYKIWFSIKNNINYLLEDVEEIENEEYTEDVMRSMYIDKCLIVLPSGKIINLLEGNIDIIHHYNGSEKETGILYKEEQNVKLQYIDGVKQLFFSRIKDGDGVTIYFYAKIPAYFVNSIRIEYRLTVEWENRGTVKKHSIEVFKKKVGVWAIFSV